MPYYPPRPEESPREDPPRRPSAARWILLCVSAVLLIYGGYRLISYFSDLRSSRQTAAELREIAQATETEAIVQAAETGTPLPAEDQEPAEIFPASASTSAPQPMEKEGDAAVKSSTLPAVPYPGGYEIVPRIRELRKKSANIIGWLKMDDVDEPVAHKDNTFFLDHDALGKKNVNGAIFMDEQTNLLTRPYTILLYGHNMKTGAMFGNLRKYETFSYCYQHRNIQFDTLYEEGQYVIFAAESIRVTPGKSGYFNLSALQSMDRATRRDALEALINRSLFAMPLEVNEEDQLLLLITCTGDEDERLIVAARRLREGETADTLIH